jgi:hypothetical protein
MAVVLLCSHAAAVPEGRGARQTLIAVVVTARVAADLSVAAARCWVIATALSIPLAQQPCCQRITRKRPSAALRRCNRR